MIGINQGISVKIAKKYGYDLVRPFLYFDRNVITGDNFIFLTSGNAKNECTRIPVKISFHLVGHSQPNSFKE